MLRDDIKEQGHIVWFSSYPKSGNTWFRAFYTNLIRNLDKPAGVNELEPRLLAGSRNLFDQYTGIESSDLNENEIERLRPRVFEIISREIGKEGNPVYMKIHDAYTKTSLGEWLVSPKATKAALYFIRNPLDVAVSFAHHNSCSIDKMIEKMGDENYALNFKANRIGNQLKQRLTTWSNHVTGWIDQLGDRLHIMRYEDMVRDTLNTFTKAVNFLELPNDGERIQKALRFSDIRELQKQEEQYGFKEKSQSAASFFRQGKSGSWREVLTSSQVERIIGDHGEVMKRLGYLNEKGELLF